MAIEALVDHSDTTEHLYNQVAGHLKKRIKDKDFGEDGRIPNYVTLSQEYNVSMSTIKKAMQILNEQNVITSRVGKGTYATPEFLSSYQKTQTRNEGQIGLLIRDIEGPYFSGVYRGLADQAEKHSKQLLLTVSRDIHQQEESLLTMMVENRAEGLLITTRRKSLFGISIFDKIYEEKIPTVIIHDVYGSKVPIVDVDNYLGGRLAAEHFLKLKIKKFMAISGERGSRLDDMRLRGFVEGLKDGGIAVQQNCLTYRMSFATENSLFEEGYKLGKSVSFKELEIKGVFIYNDLLAMGFQKGVLERGYRIPQDLAVIGFDNVDRVMEAWIPLTTIESPRKQIGETAINVLLELIDKKRFTEMKNNFLKPKLIIRDSA